MRAIFLLILLTASGSVLGQGAHYTYPFTLTCPEGVVVSGATVAIGVNFVGGHTGERYEPTYSWSVTGGTIVQGQGTKEIQLRLDSRASDLVQVTMSRRFIQAHYPEVQRDATCQITIVPRPAARMTDEFRTRGDNCEDGLARLDAFLAELNNNPDSNGVIVFYGDTTEKDAARIRKIQLSRYTSIRGFDVNRIRFELGVPRESGTTQFWIVPPGAELPPIEAAPETVERRPRLPYMHSALYADGLAECHPYTYDIAAYARVLNMEPKARARIIISEPSRSMFHRKLREITATLAENGVSQRRVVAIYKKVRPNRLLESTELWVIAAR